jgi:hypothetical protein
VATATATVASFDAMATLPLVGGSVEVPQPMKQKMTVTLSAAKADRKADPSLRSG